MQGWLHGKIEPLRRARGAMRDITDHVTIDGSADQILDMVYSANLRPHRLWIPLRMTRMQGGFGYGGWHPFVEALRHGKSVLERFYSAFTPKTLSSVHFLPEAARPLPPWELPWLEFSPREPPAGEAGIPAEEGFSAFGPVTSRKVASEFHRLESTRASIRRSGYKPDDHGDITGHFMRSGDQFVFFVRTGKHRAAALAAEGWSTIPVRFKDFWPRLIDRKMAAEWPLVRAGLIPEEAAAAVLARYVEWDGGQQREVIWGKSNG